jgi:hypothetical protein
MPQDEGSRRQIPEGDDVDWGDGTHLRCEAGVGCLTEIGHTISDYCALENLGGPKVELVIYAGVRARTEKRNPKEEKKSRCSIVRSSACASRQKTQRMGTLKFEGERTLER